MGRIFNIPSFIFCEDDYNLVKEFANLAYLWAKHIVSPNICSIGKWKSKRFGYNGSQKTGYLHTNFFQPDPETLIKYGIFKQDIVDKLNIRHIKG